MPSSRAKPNLRRQIYLSLVSKIEGQLRDVFTAKAEDEGMTKSLLADKLDVHRSVVGRRLNGRTNMTIETLADMVWATEACIDIDIYDPKTKPERNNVLAPPTVVEPRLIGLISAPTTSSTTLRYEAATS